MPAAPHNGSRFEFQTIGDQINATHSSTSSVCVLMVGLMLGPRNSKRPSIDALLRERHGYEEYPPGLT